MKKWEAERPENKMMALLASLTAAIVALGDVKAATGGKETAEQLLKSMTELAKKTDQLRAKPDPKLPDNKELVREINSLGDTLRVEIEHLRSAIDSQKLNPKIQVQPPVVNVPQPKVNVDAPDFVQLEKKLDSSFKELVDTLSKLVPDIPDFDTQSLEERLDKVVEQLKDIDTGVRMKPLPGTIKVTNTDGSAVGGGASTVADGADVAQGATTDAAVVTDATGTLSGKLRGLVKWAFERMPASLGQKTMANSLPVTLPSDQSSIPISTIGTSVTPGTAAANLGKAEDAVHTSGDVGVMGLGVYKTTPTQLAGSDGDYATSVYGANGEQFIGLATLIAGEDQTNNVMKVEGQFSYTLCAAADTLVKSGAGLLHSLTISQNDAAPTAGTIIVYDNTAESGTQIFNWNVLTTTFLPFTVVLDIKFNTGLYVGYTTTADVNVTAAWR